MKTKLLKLAGRTRQWRCPDCQEVFDIPLGQDDPMACDRCVKRAKSRRSFNPFAAPVQYVSGLAHRVLSAVAIAMVGFVVLIIVVGRSSSPEPKTTAKTTATDSDLNSTDIKLPQANTENARQIEVVKPPETNRVNHVRDVQPETTASAGSESLSVPEIGSSETTETRPILRNAYSSSPTPEDIRSQFAVPAEEVIAVSPPKKADTAKPSKTSTPSKSGLFQPRSISVPQSRSGMIFVKPYRKKDGTWVRGYWRKR